MELDFVDQIRKKVCGSHRLLLGIGDDAAILNSRDSNTVVTVDLLTEGVDFLVEQTPLPLIGRKSLAVNLSDLAAMAAIPHSVVVAVALPRRHGMQIAEGIMEGILALANEYDIAIAGGDTNSWEGDLVISITAIGLTAPSGPLLRSGAMPGDRIVTTGRLGGSFPERQFTFCPRIREALFLKKYYDLHAGMDISDGLLLDLSRLVGESHCSAVVEENNVPVHDDVGRCWQIIESTRSFYWTNPKIRSLLDRMDPRELNDLKKAVVFPFNIDCSDPERSLGQALWLESAESLLNLIHDANTEQAISQRNWSLRRALNDGEDFELILAVPQEETERLLKEQPLWDHGISLTDIGYFQDIQEGVFIRDKNGNIRSGARVGGYIHQFE